MVGWFEIPVADMARAIAFYEAVFDLEIQMQDLNELQMGIFPFAEGAMGAWGALVKHLDFYHPSASEGPLLYFSCRDVQVQTDRIERAGGTVLQPKKLISEGVGYMALFLDSEGNRLALHSRE